MGDARLSEHGWGGLSDLYEPYLLSKEMSGNEAARLWLYEASGGNQVDGLSPAPVLPSLSGLGCWEFELPADLLEGLLGKASNSATQDGGGTNTRWASLVC